MVELECQIALCARDLALFLLVHTFTDLTKDYLSMILVAKPIEYFMFDKCFKSLHVVTRKCKSQVFDYRMRTISYKLVLV